MFGILAERMSSSVLEYGLINTSVQKAGIPGFPGCLEHTSKIWHTIQECKKLRKNLSVVWLDLANAYGSVPHALIEFATEILWIPEKVRNFIMQYYSDFHMRFTTNQLTTSWQSLDVGIPMGCAIVLFVLAMEIIISSGKSGTKCIVEGCRRTSSYKSIYG